MMEGARARYMAQRLTAAIIIGPQKASGNPHANGKMGPPGGAPGPGPRVITPACQRAIRILISVPRKLAPLAPAQIGPCCFEFYGRAHCVHFLSSVRLHTHFSTVFSFVYILLVEYF